ncbi:MAG: prepilin-type N-terminal cleavage/methylation domain-containing protein [Candidatus Paceibacteria bacterium]
MINMRLINHNKKAGFSLIESLIYIAIIAAMAALVVNVLLVTTKSYNSLRISRDINNSALTTIERITREVKAAEGINIAESVFDVHPGRLIVTTSATTTEFYLDSSTLKIKENNVDMGALVQQGSSVDNLVFRMLDNSTTKGIRIEMTISNTRGSLTKTKNFYSFAVLRN